MDPAGRDPAIGPTVAIALALTLAATAIAVSAMVLAVEPEPIRGLDAAQRQNAESALYLISLAVLVPIALLVGPRLSARVASGPNGGALSSLAALLTASLAALVLGARAIDALVGGGTAVLLAGSLLWTAAAAAALARAGRAPEWQPSAALAARTRELWIAAGVLVAAVPLVVSHPRSLSIAVLIVGALVVGLCARAVKRETEPRTRRRAWLAVDLAVVALLVLLVPDLVVLTPEDPAVSSFDRFLPSIMQFHHNFLVGPANQVLAGDVLLRDAASQYGVGSIYFLVGWFELATISYGSFALLDGLLTAGLLATGYAVLRMAGCSRVLAGSALGVAVVALVFNRLYPVGMLPQEGPFRFGLPMGVIVATVVAARWPRHARAARAGALVVVGVSAIWALEAFAATAAVFTALACFEAYLSPRGARVRLLVRRLSLAAAAAVVAHVLFAAAMLVWVGDLPDWGQYLAFLREFLVGDLGDLTYDFSRWSPGLAVGAAYLSSATALLVVLRLRPALVAARRVAFTAVTGLTASGLTQFAYFVDRSDDHVAAYVAGPALLAAALWLSLVLRAPAQVTRDARIAAVAVTGAAAVLLVATGWSSIQTPLSRSALAHLVPGGDSARAAVARLRAFPAIDARAPEGERLLNAFMPGERRSIVITEPDLSVEILVRRQRGNTLPISNPRADDFTFDERLPGILEAVRRLEPGRRMLVDAGALSALATARRNPRSPLLFRGGAALAAVQLQALYAIQQRFRLRLVERGAAGLVVLELASRRRAQRAF